MKKSVLTELFERLQELIKNNDIILHQMNGTFCLVERYNGALKCAMGSEYMSRQKMETFIKGLINGICSCSNTAEKPLYVTSPRKHVLENNRYVSVGKMRIEPRKLCNLKSISVEIDDSFGYDDLLFVYYDGAWREVCNIDFE